MVCIVDHFYLFFFLKSKWTVFCLYCKDEMSYFKDPFWVVRGFFALLSGIFQGIHQDHKASKFLLRK